MQRSKMFNRSSHKARRSQRRDQPSPHQHGPGDAVAGLCPQHAHDAREGSTLLIVMVLLGMLSLIGFLFYTFAANERSNAASWSEAQKVYTSDLDPDILFDWSLKQLIIGPDASLTQSALYGRLDDAGGNFRFGSRHAMLPNLLGRDVHSYNSAAVHLSSTNINAWPAVSNATDGNMPFVDMDLDRVADSVSATTPLGQQPLDLNDSGAANGGTARTLTNWPDPGVDYTYPDINSAFLAYKGFAIDAAGNTVQVIIPSFHRPQLLRTGASGQPSATWYQDAEFAGRVFRPHPQHRNPDGSFRFPSAVTGTLTSVFPFRSGTNAHQGVWSRTNRGDTTNYAYEWDVDNDGDLIKEGVWLDLQYPVQTDSLGQKYVPLFSFTVYDADGLFNLNAHGNQSASAAISAISEIPGLAPYYLSRSNQGLTSFEVNLQHGLSAAPNNFSGDFSGTTTDLAAATTQHTFEYGWSPSNSTNATDIENERRRLANIEWHRLLVGSANFQSATTLTDLYPGRYGELSTLYAGIQYGITNGSSASATPINRLPYPGIANLDDNCNRFEGMYNWELQSNATAAYFPSLATTYYPPLPYGQPLDFNADGTIAGSIVRDGMNNMELTSGLTSGSPAGSAYGKNRMMIRNTSAAQKSLLYPGYLRYDNPGANATYAAAGTADFTNLNSAAAGWRNGTGTLAGEQMFYPAYNSTAMKWYGVPYLSSTMPPLTQLDEDQEMILDALNASSSDMIFPYDEMAALHLAKTDRDNLGLSSRTRILAPFNFGASTRADNIAQQFSVASWDRRQFGFAGTSYHRTWEFTGGTTFPPNYGGTINSGTDPFRPAVRRLLGMTIGSPTTTTANQYQFRLSLNHLTVLDTNGLPARRELTPHNPNLTEAPAGGNAQESLARLDRQQMARDIYVMLYTLGGGLDTDSQSGFTGAIGAAGYTGDNSGFNLYNERQLREMAQFAVNVVDALDSDRVMTKFEYDKNLYTGWELDDNAYTIDDNGDPKFDSYTTPADAQYNADYPEDSPERGVVFGVEAQDVALSEALAFFCPKIKNTSGTALDHPATAHDDKEDRYYTYIELRNVGASRVAFDGQYRLRAIPEGGIERRLTLTGNAVAPGDLYTIGSAGQTDAGLADLIDIDRAAPTAGYERKHSRFRCDNPNVTGAVDFTLQTVRIAPQDELLDLDLIEHRDDSPGKFILTNIGTTPDDDSDDVNITTGPMGIPGGFVNGTTLGDAQNPETKSLSFVLERRQYPDRPASDPTDTADNPWVPVDRLFLDVGEYYKFGLQDSETMQTQYQSRLEVLHSKERAEPLQRANGSYDPAGEDPHASAIVSNSLKVENSNAPANFLIYQDRTDRPFASPVELLDVPLYGPQNVTRWVKLSVPSAAHVPSPYHQTNDFELEHAAAASSVGTANEIPTAATAAGKILQPEHFNNLSQPPASKTPVLDNRWHRLFEFYEVPSRMHRQLGNPMNIVRFPGKVGLNTIRHPAVIAGLLDDEDVTTFANASTTRPTLNSNDSLDADGNMASGVRDWWVQFLKARDGRRVESAGTMQIHPDNVTGLFLPGLADSTPFRSPGMAGFVKSSTRQSPQDALESTIFRKLPIDEGATDPRHLWEVGTANDHAGTGTNVDSVMRHRLLSKIYNNTTTRSHVFIVFVTVKLFEADDSAGAANVRIGGPLTNGATYRGFFVIDRSQPEDAYDSATGTFSNFRALIKHRQLLN